jgi:hypothetical protein
VAENFLPICIIRICRSPQMKDTTTMTTDDPRAGSAAQAGSPLGLPSVTAALRQRAPVHISRLPFRAAQPADDALPLPHAGICRDLDTLNRVLAGLRRMAE